MLEFVELLLNSCDNIISQLILLKKFKHHKEVRKYMKALKKENISKLWKNQICHLMKDIVLINSFMV